MLHTALELQRYPCLSGSQAILTAANRTTQPCGKVSLHYWEARLPEVGLCCGIVSLQDMAILLFWRAATAEPLLRECPSRAISLSQDVTSFADTLLKGQPLQKCTTLLPLCEKFFLFLLSLAQPSSPP